MTKDASRGRPRQYDPAEALAAALHAFRQKGYTGTSLDDLSEATGMKRPSLYAAFGNKRDIYLKAVESYTRDEARHQSEPLFDKGSLIECLEAYFEAVITSYSPAKEGALGCPVMSVIVGEAPSDPEINAALVSTIRNIDALFYKRLEAAQILRELSPQADLRALAMLLGGLQQSLALRARAGASREELTRFIRSGIFHLLADERSGRPNKSGGNPSPET